MGFKSLVPKMQTNSMGALLLFSISIAIVIFIIACLLFGVVWWWVTCRIANEVDKNVVCGLSLPADERQPVQG